MEINGRHYVFYHRMTDKSTYSRQACAEEIQIAADGKISQVRITSCGLNGGPLAAEGMYPAAIACVLKKGRMPHVMNGSSKKKIPYIGYENGQPVIRDITSATTIGFRWFLFRGDEKSLLEMTGDFSGAVEITTELEGPAAATIPVKSVKVQAAALGLNGEKDLYLKFIGTGSSELHSLSFVRNA